MLIVRFGTLRKEYNIQNSKQRYLYEPAYELFLRRPMELNSLGELKVGREGSGERKEGEGEGRGGERREDWG